MLDEAVDVGAVGMRPRRGSRWPRTTAPSRRGTRAPCSRVRCLPPFLHLAVAHLDDRLDRQNGGSSALAPPIRPPFFRLSSVSSAPQTFVRAASECTAATTSSCPAPAAARRAAATAIMPWPIVTERESTTVTGTTSATLRAASSALCIVADSAADRDTTITPVAPGGRERPVRLLERAGSGRGRLGQRRRRGTALPRMASA